MPHIKKQKLVRSDDGSVISATRWAAGISGYDNGEMNLTGCTVENVRIEGAAFVGGIAALGAAGAKINDNAVKNITIALVDTIEANELTYGTIVGGVSVYSYSAKPVYVNDENTVEGVVCTVNESNANGQKIGSKYEDGTDQGLIMTSTIKVEDGYYTYLKKAIEAAPKDGTEYVIELTGDTMITNKFKPSVAKGQNVVIKTNGYDLIWVEQDANKVPVLNVDGSYVTTVVTAENMSSYIKVASGGTLVIE